MTRASLHTLFFNQSTVQHIKQAVAFVVNLADEGALPFFLRRNSTKVLNINQTNLLKDLSTNYHAFGIVLKALR